MRKYFSILQKTGLFSGFSEEKLSALLQDRDIKFLNYQKGYNLFIRRDNYEDLMIIVSGCVKVESIGADGRVIQIREFKAPDVVAPFFLFGSGNFPPFHIQASNDIKLLKIPKSVILRLFQNDKTLLERFLEMISDRIIFLSSKMAFLHFNTISKKLAFYLLDLKVDPDGSVTLDHSILQLSEYFGVERPSLSKVIGQFVSQGIIEHKSRRNIRILDRDKLKRLLPDSYHE